MTIEDVYRVLQRELPPGDVYPDSGNPSAFFSTADMYSTAVQIAAAYTSVSGIYVNNYPNTAVDTEPFFEFSWFGYTLDASLPLAQRKQQLLTKIRLQKRTTPQDILNAVYTVIPPSVFVEILPWGCGAGIDSNGDILVGLSWILDQSQLEINTYLNAGNGVERVGPDLCTLDAADYGLSPADFAALQDQAYTYQVNIYGYTLTPSQRASLDLALSADEPARSQHVIVDGLNPADEIMGDM